MYKVSSIWIKELCTTTTSLIYHQNENRTELEDNNNNKENGFFSDTFGFQPISPYQQGAEALQKEKNKSGNLCLLSARQSFYHDHALLLFPIIARSY
jgi:hypothetical protein